MPAPRRQDADLPLISSPLKAYAPQLGARLHIDHTQLNMIGESINLCVVELRLMAWVRIALAGNGNFLPLLMLDSGMLRQIH